MIKVEDFKDIGILEETLHFKQFEENGVSKEIVLSACFEPIKDSAWYQINIGECLEDEYKDTEEHRFNSLKKAVKWWNKYFEESKNDNQQYS